MIYKLCTSVNASQGKSWHMFLTENNESNCTLSLTAHWNTTKSYKHLSETTIAGVILGPDTLFFLYF